MLVLLNPAAGTLVGSPIEDVAARVGAGLRDAGVDAEVRVVPGDQMGAAAREAARGPHEAVIAGGGDGTLNTVAAELLDTGKAFGVLPLGTHNLFAKAIGMPLPLDAAVAALAAAEPQTIDVAEVNGRPFLNFAGLGLHPAVVSEREAMPEPRKRNRFVVLAIAFLRVLRRLPLLRVGLPTPEGPRWRVTPSVIVCANPWPLTMLGVESATSEPGLLHVYLARNTRWLAIAWLAVRMMLRQGGTARSFETLALPEVTLRLHRWWVSATIDGEVVTLTTPLVFRLRRGALRVLTPTTTEP